MRDVSRLLKIPEKVVYRWVNEDELPAYRLNDQYFFNQTEVLEWASSRGIAFPPDLFLKKAQPFAPSLAEALEWGGIFHSIQGDNKPAIFHAIVQVMPLPANADRERILGVLLAREALATTGVGDGIALPHVRNPIVLPILQPSITLCFLAAPVDFGASDGKPVHCVFTLLSPTVRSHLHLLSELGFALRVPSFGKVIRDHGNKREILNQARDLEALLKQQARPGTGTV